MDTDDASGIPEYVQLLQKQKRMLRDAQSRKGERPRGMKSRDQLVMEFHFRLMMSANTRQQKFHLRQSFVPQAYDPCVKPSSDLRKIMLKDLLLETHHRGSYVLVRSVTPADRMNAVMAIVEDENGDAFTFQLYHQEKERTAADILPKETVMIIKEPYLKLMADGGYGIRVDHLSDVTYLSTDDERIPCRWERGVAEHGVSAGVWKEKGNNHFNRSQFHAAIECYAKAFDCAPTIDEAHTLKLNRSLALLKAEQFDAALDGLESASSTSQKPTAKLLFRKAQVLYRLQRYRECCEVLKVLCLEYPDNVQAKGDFTRSIKRIAEQSNGKYPFKQLYDEARKLRPPRLDRATYIGPVSVKPSGSRGRGLFTTKAVEAGDLLLCEKAFAYAFGYEEYSKDVSLLINAETDTMTMGTQGELITIMARRLYQNPSLASIITDLHHGSYTHVGVSDVDGSPVVDTFLLERIVSLNVFGCPLSTREDLLRAKNVSGIGQEASIKAETFHSTGIWPTASYINHCCDSNACRSFIGDMMIVRATRDIAPDTEVTFWYRLPSSDGDGENQKKFRQQWGFKCDCVICQNRREEAAKNSSVVAKRKNLRASAAKYFQSQTRTKITKIERILSALEETYSRPAVEVPRLDLWDPLVALARRCLERRQPAQAIEPALKALESLGYVIDGGKLPRSSDSLPALIVKRWGLMMNHGLVECWMLLAGAYHVVAPDLEAQAVAYARISYKMVMGEDETFAETYRAADYYR